jgi:mono/diheme cytochrome c family protein
LSNSPLYLRIVAATIIMKITLKIALVVATLVGAVWAVIPARSDAGVSVIDSGDAQASVYRANCAKCHGNDGRADTPKGREMDADDLTTGKVKGMSVDKLTRVIKNGKGDMPGFGKKLSAAQITGLVKYVKSL